MNTEEEEEHDRKGRSRKRWALVIMYFLMFLAGIWAMAVPSQAVVAALRAATWIWASFLLLGGFFCFVGRLRDRLGGELVGIPLLSSSCMIFALALFIFASSAAAISIGFIFTALGVGILDRWAYIRKLLRKRKQLQDREAEDNEP